MKTYNIVLVGCGYIGGQHLDDIYYRDNVNILAVVDTVLDNAKMFAHKYGAEHYGTDYKEFISDPRADIVIVATNVDSHYEITEYSVKHNKHVICEKPISSNYEDALKFFDLVKNASSKVIIGHILRHNKSYHKISDIIKSGKIGDLKLIRVVQNHHAVNWQRYKRLLNDCSPATDCGVHYFDVMSWFSNSPIVKVTAIDAKLDNDCKRNNYDMVFVEMENGCKGFYEGGWSKNLPCRNEKEFIGTKGHIRLTLMNDRPNNHEEGDLIEVYTSEDGEYKIVNNISKYKDMYGQLMSLIDMIENDTPPAITMEEVLNSFLVAQAAETSIDTEAVANIEEVNLD